MNNPFKTILYSGTLVVLFVYVISVFSYREAADAATLWGEGLFAPHRVVVVVNTFCVLSISQNLFSSSRTSGFVVLHCLWLIWTLVTCLNLWEYDWKTIAQSVSSVCYAPLLFLCSYLAARDRPRSLFLMNIVFMVLFLLCLSLYLLVRRLNAAIVFDRAVVLNDVYYVLLLVPWVFLFPIAGIRHVAVCLAGFAVVLSMKRTAAVTFALSVLGFFAAERMSQRRGWDLRWICGVAAVVGGVAVAALYMAAVAEGQFVERFERIGADRGSGRLDIYEVVLELQMSGGLRHWLFGAGFNGVFGMIGHSAHNDWLEALYDYGVVGLMLYTCFHVLVVRDILRFIRGRSCFAAPLAASYLVFLGMSLTSHLILYPTYFGFLVVFWGWVYGVSERQGMDLSPPSTALGKGDHGSRMRQVWLSSS